MSSPFAEVDRRMRRLAGAYGVEPLLDTVAGAIIGRTNIPAGTRERNAVIAVVASAVGPEEAWEALVAGRPFPTHLTDEIMAQLAHHQLAMPAGALIFATLSDLTLALRTGS